MCTYLIQGFRQECVAVLLPFPLWSRAVQEGWLVGWLHRKGNSLYQTADGGQHVLTLQKHTHTHARRRSPHAVQHTRGTMRKYSSFYEECDPDRTLEDLKFSWSSS